MSTSFGRTEADLLEQSDLAISNVQSQPTIAAAMAELGYDNAMIEEGAAINKAAHDAYNLNLKEDDETRVSYQVFDQAKAALKDFYGRHRKKAKVIFMDDPAVAANLLINKALPRAYTNWINCVEKFYRDLGDSEELQARVARLKITVDEITQGQNLVTDLRQKRKHYKEEIGESERATQAKDAALGRLDKWMSEFYAVARIALEDEPQLLEALGKSVKS
jgi:hypothetical protein